MTTEFLMTTQAGEREQKLRTLVHCWFTPALKVTVMLPGETVKRYRHEAYIGRMERKSGCVL